MVKTITINVDIPLRKHDLAINIFCVYFDIDRDELFIKDKRAINAERRYLLYYILHEELNMLPAEICEYLGVRKNLYHYGIQMIRSNLRIYRYKYKYDIDNVVQCIRDALGK